MSIFSGHSSSIQALAWVSPSEGKRLLSASETSELYLWDPTAPYTEPITKFQGASDPRFHFENGITSLVVNSAGTLALVGGAQDAALKIVNLASGQFVHAIAGGHKPLSSIEALSWVDLAPSLGIWVSGASDGSVCAWEGTSGTLRWKAEHPQPPQPEPQPSSTQTEGQDQEMKDAEAAQAALENEERIAVTCLALHPSKTAIVSSAADGSLRSWDARSGAPLAEYPGHSRAIHAAVITPDGQLVLSAGDNGIVRVHKAQPAAQ
jgi:ribosome assembly protein SQT1